MQKGAGTNTCIETKGIEDTEVNAHGKSHLFFGNADKIYIGGKTVLNK